MKIQNFSKKRKYSAILSTQTRPLLFSFQKIEKMLRTVPQRNPNEVNNRSINRSSTLFSFSNISRRYSIETPNFPIKNSFFTSSIQNVTSFANLVDINFIKNSKWFSFFVVNSKVCDFDYSFQSQIGSKKHGLLPFYNFSWQSQYQYRYYKVLFTKNISEFIHYFPDTVKPFYGNDSIDKSSRINFTPQISYNVLAKTRRRKKKFYSLKKHNFNSAKSSSNYIVKYYGYLKLVHLLSTTNRRVFNTNKKITFNSPFFNTERNSFNAPQKQSFFKAKKSKWNKKFISTNVLTQSSLEKKKEIYFQTSISSTTSPEKNYSVFFTKQERSQLLNSFLGTSTSIFRINSFAFSRFAFDFHRKNYNQSFLKKIWFDLSKNKTSRGYSSLIESANKKKQKVSSTFLRAVGKEIRSRYRYIGVYIKDLVRIIFVSFYCKYAQFLISFFAFALSKLPRNRKETTFIRFFVKLLKRFAVQRKEILGVRVRFQGRINRWRRTKHIFAQKGILPLHTYSCRMSYGIAQSIIRKGSFGCRLWISYDSYFAQSYNRTFFYFLQTFSKLKN